MAKKLTKMQSAWARAYVENGGNATRAAEEAGYKGGVKNWQQVGFHNTRNTKIREQVESILIQDIMSEAELVHRLSSQSVPVDVLKYYKMVEYVKVVGEEKVDALRLDIDLQAIRDDGLGHRVKKIKMGSNDTPEIEWHDHNRSLAMVQHHYDKIHEYSRSDAITMMVAGDDGVEREVQWDWETRLWDEKESDKERLPANVN